MKTLLLMRHAKSSWKDSELADHDRPLNSRGKRDGPRMGRMLQEMELIPHRILCSSAVRTKLTCEALLSEWETRPTVIESEELYHASAETILETIQREAQGDCCMVIAHNPGLEDFLEALLGNYERMPTAAIAWLEFPINQWSEASFEIDQPESAVMKQIWKPKEI